MALPKNPYSSPDVDPDDVIHEHTPQSKWKRLLLGFVIGGSIPFMVGVYLIFRSHTVAELNQSGGFISGAVSLRALLLIFIASPLLGIVGAITCRLLRT